MSDAPGSISSLFTQRRWHSHAAIAVRSELHDAILDRQAELASILSACDTLYVVRRATM